MTLEEKVLSDFKEAMKARDQLRSTALSFLRAQFSYAALEKKKDKLDDSECLQALAVLEILIHGASGYTCVGGDLLNPNIFRSNFSGLIQNRFNNSRLSGRIKTSESTLNQSRLFSSIN